jgi:hypothetical protein
MWAYAYRAMWRLSTPVRSRADNDRTIGLDVGRHLKVAGETQLRWISPSESGKWGRNSPTDERKCNTRYIRGIKRMHKAIVFTRAPFTPVACPVR